MADQLRSGVVVSFEDDGKVRIRRFMVVTTNGKCLISYTPHFPDSDKFAVGHRREWDIVCTLDGKELPMVADPYPFGSTTGWRINRPLTPEEVHRLKCEWHVPLLEEAS